MHRPGREHSVDDLEQHVRLLLLERGGGSSDTLSFVAQFARWRIADLYRHGRRETPLSVSADGRDVMIADIAGGTIDDAIEDYDVPPTWSGELWQWVWELTEPQRDVLLLHYVAETPMPDVACTLGITLNAAKSLRNRAIAQLRRKTGSA